MIGFAVQTAVSAPRKNHLHDENLVANDLLGRRRKRHLPNTLVLSTARAHLLNGNLARRASQGLHDRCTELYHVEALRRYSQLLAQGRETSAQRRCRSRQRPSVLCG